MRLIQSVPRRWILCLFLVCDLLLLARWMIRPVPVISWFGEVAPDNETPLTLLKAWVNDDPAPRDAGWAALPLSGRRDRPCRRFADHFVGVTCPISRPTWRDHRTSSWSSRPIQRIRPLLATKVRTLLIVIAVVSLELGEEYLLEKLAVDWRVPQASGSIRRIRVQARESLQRVMTMLANSERHFSGVPYDHEQGGPYDTETPVRGLREEPSNVN